MIKVISAARRNPRLSVDEFRRAMRVDHAPLMAQMPGLLSYVVNFPITGVACPWDAVVELGFEDPATFQAALASSVGQRSLSHMREIVDPASIQSGVFEVSADASPAAIR